MENLYTTISTFNLMIQTAWGQKKDYIQVLALDNLRSK